MCRTGPFSAYAADVWATGVCVFVFVAAKLPFWGESPGDLFDAIQNHELVLPPGLSEGMARLLRGLEGTRFQLNYESFRAESMHTDGNLANLLDGGARRLQQQRHLQIRHGRRGARQLRRRRDLRAVPAHAVAGAAIEPLVAAHAALAFHCRGVVPVLQRAGLRGALPVPHAGNTSGIPFRQHAAAFRP